MTNSRSPLILVYPLLFVGAGLLPAVNIVIDYRYDTNDFFTIGGVNPDAAAARASLFDAAERWSNVLEAGNLQAAGINSGNNGRIGFSHPGTGASFQVSGSGGAGSDPLVGLTLHDKK